MALFDWNASIKLIPDDWRNTKGSGIKIAILDTGADLTHPALKHLDVDGRKFDVTKDNFDPNDLSGKDDIADEYRNNNPHGTKCSSIIAAKVDAQSVKQLNGVAPEAEIYLIRVGAKRKSITLERLLLGLELALKLDVDIISTSFLPNRTTRFSQSRVDTIFEKVKNNKILLCATLENTDTLDEFNNPDRLPTLREEVIKVGTMFKFILDDVGSGIQFSDKIGLLLPEVFLTYCIRAAEGSYKDDNGTCSTATACAAGIFALLLAFKRKQDVNFKRFTKEEAMTEINQIRLAFDFNTVKNCTDLQFFSPLKNNQP